MHTNINQWFVRKWHQANEMQVSAIPPSRPVDRNTRETSLVFMYCTWDLFFTAFKLVQSNQTDYSLNLHYVIIITPQTRVNDRSSSHLRVIKNASALSFSYCEAKSLCVKGTPAPSSDMLQRRNMRLRRNVPVLFNEAGRH